MTSGYDAHQMALIRGRATLGLADPVDAAGTVAYFPSAAASRIAGTVITVVGGSTA